MKYLIACFGFLCLILCGGEKNVYYIPESNQTILDADGFSSGARNVAWTPSGEETHLALLKIYNVLIRSSETRAGSVIDKRSADEILKRFSDYKVQFIGFHNRENKKYIHCNFFIDTQDLYRSWRSKYVLGQGGGTRYWRVMIGLDSDSPNRIYVNDRL